MSTRYDFMLMCNLRDDIPKQVIDTLRYMTRTEDYEFNDPPDNRAFRGNWWRDSMRLHPVHRDMGTYTGDTIHIFRRSSRGGPNDTTICFYVLQLRTIMHDDLSMEYLCFVNWVAPYSERKGFVGYYHSGYAIDEGTNPTLLYFIDGKLHITKEIIPRFVSVAEWCDDGDD